MQQNVLPKRPCSDKSYSLTIVTAVFCKIWGCNCLAIIWSSSVQEMVYWWPYWRHNLNQCWQRFTAPYGMTCPHSVQVFVTVCTCWFFRDTNSCKCTTLVRCRISVGNAFKLKSRVVSFANNLLLKCQIVLQFCTEHGGHYYCPVLCKFSKRYLNGCYGWTRFPEILVWGEFRRDILYCNCPWAPSQYKDRLIYVWRFPC